MFFKQRVFKNELTKLLGDPDTTLEMTLLHHEFSITIRNEYEGLYQRILGTENDEYNNEWFKKIIGYALFDAKPPEKEKENNRIKQINNNASNFLECCSKRFKDALKKSKSDSMDYLMKSLDKFISNKNKTKKDPYYAGHFQRFIENFIRLNAFDNLNEVLDKIIPFLIENCYILAYQQLLTRILGDFSATLDNKIVYDLLTKMLFRAYSAVSYIYEHKSDVFSQSTVDVEINTLKRENQYKKSQQPLNLNKKSIPLIGNIIEENSADDFNFTSSQKCFYNKLKKKIKSKLEFNNRESAEYEAYLLIMSIRTSSYDQQDLIYKFREDEENNYQLIEALLYCGTFCGESSIVSLEAFRLLNIIFNGSIALSIEPWMLLEIDKQKLKFYNNYADNFGFNPKNLTYQMIHALQIFWDHRYNKESYEMLESEETEFDVSDYYSDITKIDENNKKKWKREKGETAIEILQPCLICEPPLSSALNYTATNIFVMLSKYRKDLRNNEEQTVDIRDRMLYIDETYYNFYNHHFSIKKKVRGILDLIKVIIPLPSTDPQYSVERKLRRAPLSGFIIDFFLRMYNPNINVFFNISDEVEMSEISHSQLFKNVTHVLEKIIVYKDQLNYDLIPLHILYNIPIHSELFFNNDYNEEEDIPEKPNATITIVDELDGIDENRQQKSEQKPQRNNKNDNQKSKTKEDLKQTEKRNKSAESDKNDNASSSDDEKNNQSEQKDNSNKSDKIIENESDTNSNSDEEEKPKSNQTNNINEQSKSKESGSNSKLSSDEEEKAISKSKRKSQRDPKKHTKDSNEENNNNTKNKSPSKPNQQKHKKSENNDNSNSTDDKENNQSEQEDNSNKTDKIIEKENDTNSNSDEEEKPKSNQTNNINEQSKSKESGSNSKLSSDEEEKAISKSKRKSQRDPKKRTKDSDEEDDNNTKNKSSSKPETKKSDRSDSSDDEEKQKQKPKPKPKKSDRSDSSDDEEKQKPKPKPKKSDRSDSSYDEEKQKPKPKPKPKKSDRSDSSYDEEKQKPKPKTKQKKS